MFTFLMLDPLVHVVSNILFLTILRSFVCSEVTTFASVQAALESMIFSSLIFASWNKYLNAYWKNLKNVYKQMSHEIDQLEFQKYL